MSFAIYANASTVTFSATDSHIYFLGNYNVGTYVTGNNMGQTYMETVINGTSATAELFGPSTGSTTYKLIVDGATSTLTVSTPGWSFVTLFSGLADTAHTVLLYSESHNDVTIYTSNSLQVTGSSPSLSSPPGFGTSYPVASVPFSTYSSFDGSPTLLSGIGNYSNVYYYTPTVGRGLRFNASVTDIKFWMYNDNGGSGPITFAVYQDGVQIATSTTVNSYTWALETIASGLDGLSHNYEIIAVNSTDSYNYYLWSIMLKGTLNPVAYTTKNTWAFYGDSITTDYMATDMRYGDEYIISNLYGASPAREGVHAMSVVTYGMNNTSQVTSLSPKPKIVFIRYGTNDESKQVSVSTFQSDYQTMLSNLVSGLPGGTPIYAEGIFPRNDEGGFTFKRANYNAAIQNAVTAVGVSNVKYINTDNWFNASTQTTDGLHPNNSGYASIANREIPLANSLASSSSYDATGPSSGILGIVSSNFTVNLPKGATFTGDQTVTVSDGGNGGTFIPSIGTASTSNMTVTPTANATSFMFTYRPVSFGTKTLTFTNGQVWIDPSALTYTATANVPTVTITPGQAVTFLTQASLTLNATTTSDGGASTTDRGFFYGPTVSYGLVASTTSIQGAGIFSKNIAGLTCNNTYHFIAFATNLTGTGTSTPDQTFTTSPCPVVPVTVPVVPSPSIITSSSGGSSASSQVSNLLAMGQIALAQKIAKQYNIVIPTTLQNTNQTVSENQSIPTQVSSKTFTRSLRLGMSGDDIKQLQILLNNKGYIISTTGIGSKGNETNMFGSLTRRALMKFQKDNKISSTGFFGPITMKFVNEVK